jgi:hypothetical protein
MCNWRVSEKKERKGKGREAEQSRAEHNRTEQPQKKILGLKGS